MADTGYLKIKNVKIPLKLKREWRSSVRYSISKKSINLTVPRFYTKDQVLNEVHKINGWASEQFDKTPSMIERFKTRQYINGQSYKIFNSEFKLFLLEENRKGLSAEIDGNNVFVKLPEHLASSDKSNLIAQLLSRVFSKHFHNDVEQRVRFLNELHFNEKINAVRLKNNQSNWGSCSSGRNINLASRLLFAPPKVLDYVIIHELAHLLEMNHSKRFWNIVAKAMPDYKKYDSWLTKEGNALRF